MCSQGPFLGSGLERISQQTGLLPSCSMSRRPRVTPACGGVCPFCRGGSTPEPQARAQNWSQLCPVSPLIGGHRVAPLLLGACPPLVEPMQVRSPIMWPPRAMRRGLVRAPSGDTRGRTAGGVPTTEVSLTRDRDAGPRGGKQGTGGSDPDSRSVPASTLDRGQASISPSAKWAGRPFPRAPPRTKRVDRREGPRVERALRPHVPQVGGAAVMAVGVWTLVEKSGYLSVLASSTFAASAYILIFAGALVMVTGFLGFSAIIREDRGCLSAVSACPAPPSARAEGATHPGPPTTCSPQPHDQAAC